MKNPCMRCLELDFCREGKYGEPCIRRKEYESNIKTIIQEVEETVNRQKLKKEGDMDAEDTEKMPDRKSYDT